MKIEWKVDKLLAPLPAALVSCGTMKKANVLTVSWTGFLNSEPLMTYVAIRPSRYSYRLIKRGKSFVINIPNKKLLHCVDVCGLKSGKDTDKFAECGITAVESKMVSAPSILECPISIECEVCDILKNPSHDSFIAKVKTITVDDQYMEGRKFNFVKAGLMMWAHRQYFEVGDFLADTFYTAQENSKSK